MLTPKKVNSALTSWKKYKNNNYFSLYSLRKVMETNEDFKNLS